MDLDIDSANLANEVDSENFKKAKESSEKK